MKRNSSTLLKYIWVGAPSVILIIVSILSISGNIIMRWICGEITDVLIVKGVIDHLKIVIFIALWAVSWCSSVAKEIIWQKNEFKIYRKNYNSLYDRLFCIKEQLLETWDIGSVDSLFVNDISNIVRFSQNFYLRFLPNMFGVSICLYFLLKIHWILPLAAIGFSTISPYVMKKFNTTIHSAHENYQSSLVKTNQTLTNQLANIEMVKAYQMEQKYISKSIEVLSNLQKACTRSSLEEAKMSFPITGSAFISIIGMLVIGGVLALKQVITVGDVLIIAMLNDSIVSPIISLERTFSLYKQALVSADKVAVFHEQETDVERGADGGRITEIMLSNVGFSYNKEKQILKNISLKITTGKPLFLMGENGCGKSTFIKLLQGVYMPSEGTILIENRPIEQWNISALRKRIQISCQEPTIIQGSIQENLNCAENEPHMFLHEALGFREEISLLTEGYNTVLNWQGKPLSRGQRQRLQIIRTLSSSGDVFILDEPTSALDSHWRKQLSTLLHTLALNHIVIVVTHDYEIIEPGDHVYYFKGGELIEK